LKLIGVRGENPTWPETTFKIKRYGRRGGKTLAKENAGEEGVMRTRRKKDRFVPSSTGKELKEDDIQKRIKNWGEKPHTVYYQRLWYLEKKRGRGTESSKKKGKD